MHYPHTGTRDAFLHGFHQERAERRRRRRSRVLALLPRRRRRKSAEDRALAAVAEATLTGDSDR